jgi:hypothetical protein
MAHHPKATLRDGHVAGLVLCAVAVFALTATPLDR